MNTWAVLSAPSLRPTNFLQRAEAALTLALIVLVCARLSAHHWLLFALVFFVPDVSLLAYVGGVLAPNRAAVVYNSLHSYIGPMLLLFIGLALGRRTTNAIALVWAAHIAFDRMLGYGLKLADGFHYTHLGPVGPLRRTATGDPTAA